MVYLKFAREQANTCPEINVLRAGKVIMFVERFDLILQGTLLQESFVSKYFIPVSDARLAAILDTALANDFAQSHS